MHTLIRKTSGYSNTVLNRVMAAVMDSTPIRIPELPCGEIKEFIPYLAKNPTTPVSELLKPYKEFESQLRKVYAQQPDHGVVKDGNVNMVPIFEGHESDLKIRARNLATETEDEAAKYIMTLKKGDRKKDGSPAIVASFKDFQKNFNLFSESSLAELDWSNVVAAGSAVTTALLPVPEKWAGSKRSLREYYHEHLAPASDVDLFIYGLDEEEAIEKIKQIERSIKDSILHETTTIRSKNAITIASQYPTRHVQIVLRLYGSISQIITGFDVDSACVAYGGDQVYAAPRAIAAFVTQCNTIDLTRRSPSYENRLSKYSHRGFEVHWPLLDRTRIDPTIFERSFGRTQGLARLLILEKLPKTSDRDNYMDQRRAERGRPAIYRGYGHGYKMAGNIKDQEEDEVAEWVEQDEVSSYHTMTVPYGPKYHAARINRLLYAKDLLLNAEWNQPDDRDVYLHRHPCFFGTAEEVIQDCCGYCPVPRNDDEIKVAEEEKKTNVSGVLQFIIDDPGRQEIGSFNPITDDEWTTMAYVGDTARLCQAIVDGDLEHVQDWCTQEGVDVNRRDYTGRTPLHLAVMASTPEVVKCLVDNGARLIARLVDGRTALHIAAARGDAEMVKILMDKSLVNEEEEDEKEDARRAARAASRIADGKPEKDADSDAESYDLGSQDSEDDTDSVTMGSFVKVDKMDSKADDGVPEDSLEDPDVYDINVTAWDYGLSPLHTAILNGHTHIIELLVSEYGADVLLPVKFVQPGSSNARGATMTLVLALSLPTPKAKEVVALLLKLGATSTQADMYHVTAFHHIVALNNSDVLDVLLENDRPAAISVLNSLALTDRYGSGVESPLTTSIKKGHEHMVSKLLELNAQPEISFDDWVKSYLVKNPHAKNNTHEHMVKVYHSSVAQPIISAAIKNMGKTVQDLVQWGANPSTLEQNAWAVVENNSRYQVGEALLDVVREKLRALRGYEIESECTQPKKPLTLENEDYYTQGLTDGSYEFWTASRDYQQAKRDNQQEWRAHEKKLKDHKEDGYKEKLAAINKLTQEFENLEKFLVDAGAKTFKELHPNAPENERSNNPRYRCQPPAPVPYKTNLSFLTADLNLAKKTGYLRLFEAAWNNDLETIKAITLAPWQLDTERELKSPLQIAVQDHNGFSPFSIAVLRGHFDLATKIVEICIAQYHEPGKPRVRWNTQPIDSDDEGYSDESDNENELPIYKELVNDKYTIDNLGEVNNIVKSDVLPLTMIEWSCITRRFLDPEKENDNRFSLLEHAVTMNDMELFKYIMKLGAEQQAHLAEEEDDQKCYTVPREVFRRAIQLGRTEILAEMIHLTGAGIPFNHLIKTIGVELKSKPKYYQGLSVGGKKRADWAQAPGGNVQDVEEIVPPLLYAARQGSIESVEWFMSDAPMRRYREFSEANKNDKRIKTIQHTGKGFDYTIGNWLNTKAELTLHCAILYNPDKAINTPKYIALLKHLIAVSPDSLEQKSSEGFTPLQLALFTQREDTVEYFISIGANQRHRDKSGRNMLHTMVAYRQNGAKTDAKKLQALLNLFDSSNFPEMLVERCADGGSGALTPLALWLKRDNGNYDYTDFLRVLCQYSNGGELEMINGEGDLPLHVTIQQNRAKLTNYLLTLNPSLLYRENAVGRTPLEMARDIYLNSHVRDPPSMETHLRYYPGQEEYDFITRRSASQFAPKPKKDDEEVGEEGEEATWVVCERVDAELRTGEGEQKRKLVSLFEANEVARRVGRAKTPGRQVVVNGYLVEDAKPDIVSEWMSG